jgi:hypothetical protein
MYAVAGKDNVAKPSDLLSLYMRDDIEPMLLFPSTNIYIGNVSNHVNMTARAALSARQG